MFVGLEKMIFIFKMQEKKNMEQVKVVTKYHGFGQYPSQSRNSPQTVQNKFSMKGCELNGQSHKQGRCDGRKRFRLFKRRCDERLFIMSGRSSGGYKLLDKRHVMIPSSMELQLIHKSKLIIASV